MPELPEVETVCRGMARTMQGATITKVTVRRADIRGPLHPKLAAKLKGRKIKNLHRRAKYIVMELDDGACCVLHLGMSGRVTLGDAKTPYKPAKHDHVIMEYGTAKHAGRMAFNDARRFGMVDYVAVGDMLPALEKLGPEPLEKSFTGDVLAARLAGKSCDIKAALLDQRVVAGLGNIYVCEALFRARIHPARKAGKIAPEEIRDLVRHIKDVLKEAIAAGGSSLKDYRTADGELGYFQHGFDVYGREGEACRACKTARKGDTKPLIRRMVQSGRSTFYCPVCQKK